MLLPTYEGSEVRQTIGIQCNIFCIDHAWFAGQLSHCLGEVAKASGEVLAVLAPDEGSRTILYDLKASAIEFHLMAPPFAAWRSVLFNRF